MKITIFGLAGTGKTTTAKILAKELNLKFNSTGNLMREKAKELNLSIYEFDQLCKKDSKYDLELDKNVQTYGKDNDNFIFESRLAWYFISDSVKIKLQCDEEIAYERIAERENLTLEESRNLTEERKQIVSQRYNSLYPNLEYPPKNDIFDLIINTSETSIEEVVEKIKLYLS
jgi:cytidylate kinase